MLSFENMLYRWKFLLSILGLTFHIPEAPRVFSVLAACLRGGRVTNQIKVGFLFNVMRGALGFSVFRFWPFFRSVFRFLHPFPSVFRFLCLFRFAVLLCFSIRFSVFGRNTSGFSDLVSEVVFGFSNLVNGLNAFSSGIAPRPRTHASATQT